MRDFKDIKIAVAGTGYVGLEHSNAAITTSSCNHRGCNSRKGGKTE